MAPGTIFALAALLLASFLPSARAEEAGLTCRFFDVDKADALLLTFPDGARLMIDAGTNKSGKALSQRFREEGIGRIDLLIITHFDKDHVGGADKILDAASVGEVLLPGYAKESKQHTQFMEALDEHPEVRVRILSAGEEAEYAFGGAALRVTAAHRDFYGKDEENDFSLSARVVFGETRFFFTGDAENARQQELLEEGGVACDVLKVPYHGRAVAASAEFLKACAPKIAWIPDGPEDEADPALVQYLEETLGADVYRSAGEGDLAVFSDGARVRILEAP